MGKEDVMVLALTDEKLESIQRRCNAATPGPWISSWEGRDHTSGDNVILRGDQRPYAKTERGDMEFSILYQELQHSTEMIRALMAGVTPEAARLKPSAESWSILEVVCHLYDEEREDFREHLDFILHRQHEAWHEIDPERENEYN